MKKIIFIFLFLTVFISQAETTTIIFENKISADAILNCSTGNTKDHNITTNPTIKSGKTREDITCLQGKNIVITVSGGAACPEFTAKKTNTNLVLSTITGSTSTSGEYILNINNGESKLKCCSKSGETGKIACSSN